MRYEINHTANIIHENPFVKYFRIKIELIYTKIELCRFVILF